jgi:hypothetical protein
MPTTKKMTARAAMAPVDLTMGPSESRMAHSLRRQHDSLMAWKSATAVPQA